MARGFCSIRQRNAPIKPVTATKRPHNNIVIRSLLWFAVIIVGFLFVLPKLTSLIKVLEQEKTEHQKALEAEKMLHHSQIKLEYLENDPQAFKKINEQRRVEDRINENE